MRPKPLLLLASVLCFGPTGASAQIIEYAHLDAVGNVRAVTDQNGVVIERHDYLPFGEECLTGPCAANPNAGAGQPRKFTGKERDTETGLDYFGARYYRGNIGRFTTVDPVYTWQENLTDPQRWNRYAYARNNPLRYVDPDGKNPVIAALVIGGLAVFYVLNNPTPANVTTGPSVEPIVPNSLVTAALFGAYAAYSRDVSPNTASPLDKARAARDAKAAEVGTTAAERPATVSAGHNRETGEIAVGCSGGGRCAEERVVDGLGGDPSKVRFTEAVRPRPGGPPFRQVPVCEQCEGRYGREPFPEGTRFKADENPRPPAPDREQ